MKKLPIGIQSIKKILSETPEDFKRGLEDTLEDLSKSNGIFVEGSSLL